MFQKKKHNPKLFHSTKIHSNLSILFSFLPDYWLCQCKKQKTTMKNSRFLRIPHLDAFSQFFHQNLQTTNQIFIDIFALKVFFSFFTQSMSMCEWMVEVLDVIISHTHYHHLIRWCFASSFYRLRYTQTFFSLMTDWLTDWLV